MPYLLNKAGSRSLISVITQEMYTILARNAEKSKTKSGNEHLLIYRSKYMLIIMHIILKWDSPSNVSKIVWNIATLNEVEWITKKRFGRRNFTRIKTKQNRQNLQVSSFLMKSKKPLGCLISKLCASLLTYILIYWSKDAQIHFWFWASLNSVPIYSEYYSGWFRFVHFY